MKAIYDVAWKALQGAILDGLRKSPEPIPASEVGAYCGVSHLLTPLELQECLNRLEEKGLIRRMTVMVKIAPPHPLAGSRPSPAYEAANRWGGGS